MVDGGEIIGTLLQKLISKKIVVTLMMRNGSGWPNNVVMDENLNKSTKC